MPSQGSQIPSQSSPLCLPLIKFSYATVSNESIAPIPWIHLSSKDALFAIFETSPVQLEDGRTEERQKFKVLQDPEVMEELDLNALSVEAHRALIQTPNVTTVNVPHVAIIVKVPMIAIKYPMPNGQIRRFQIRFSKNEDYYEAMKMLSRADVPTVEAGTFPARKPQAAPRSAAPSLVAPSDSASQIGMSIIRPRNHATNDDMSALSLSRPVPAAQSAMPPPQMFLAPAQPAQPVQYPSHVRLPSDGNLRTALPSDLEPAHPRSNVSLSTATTLVPEKQQLRFYALQPRSEPEKGVDICSRPSTRVSQQLLESQAPRSGMGLGLRGGQSVSRITRSPPNDQSCSQLADGTADAASGKGQNHEHPTSVEANDPEPTTIRGKRSAANKATRTAAAKKPRTAATRKTTTKKSQEDKRVPTVDELLQQPGYSLLPDSGTIESRSILCVQNNPTESNRTKSMEISETDYDADQPPAHGSPCLGGTANRRITRSVSQALSCGPIQYVTGSDGDVYKAPPPPCTPADQIITNPLTPASPVARAHTTALPQPTSLSHPREPEAAPHTQETQLPTLSLADNALLGLAQQCLSADPTFDLCSAHSRLEAWLSLPEPTQATALRTYFCELIMTEGFSQLCKSVDLLWEGAILEGRMMVTTITDPGAGTEADEQEV